MQKYATNIKWDTDGDTETAERLPKEICCEFIDFKDGTQQYRVDYIVEKTKDFTYNDLYKAVNSVKACYYKVK